MQIDIHRKRKLKRPSLPNTGCDRAHDNHPYTGGDSNVPVQHHNSDFHTADYIQTGTLKYMTNEITIYYSDVIMDSSHVTNLTIVYSTVYSGADERKYQSSESLAFVRGIHR